MCWPTWCVGLHAHDPTCMRAWACWVLGAAGVMRKAIKLGVGSRWWQPPSRPLLTLAHALPLLALLPHSCLLRTSRSRSSWCT